MVRNTGGGNKAKGQGRKFLNDSKPKALRTADDPLEMYARVSKNFGNGMVEVDCIDHKVRLCHIRGKFRGRSKKDNFIGLGSWILVGLREYESRGDKNKKENCDLLEVYNDFDKEKLKTSVNMNWSTFIMKDNIDTNLDPTKVQAGEIVFQDEKVMDYEELMMAQSQGSNKAVLTATTSNNQSNDDDEINVDDI